MNKYIIELGEDANMVQVISVTQSGNAYIDSTVYVEYLEQLNSDYINEHFGDLQDDAYNKGYAQCQDDYGDALKHAKDTAYQRGLAEGREQMPCDTCAYRHNNLLCADCKWTYGSRYKVDSIGVGDEVKPFYTDIPGVVTLIDGDTIYVLWRDGSSTSTLKLKEVTKTGRRFDIVSILEDMKA